MGLGSLIEAVDGLVHDDPSTLADVDSLVELRRQAARLEAVIARATARFDRSGAWRAEGARSAAAAVAAACRTPVARERRMCRLGRAMDEAPVTAAAWLDGNVSGDHVAVLARARTAQTATMFERDEWLLVTNATSLSHRGFLRSVEYWIQRADPDGAEDAAAAQRDGRSLHLSQSFDAMWFGRVALDPVSGTIVDGELRRLEQAMFDADWAAAKARLGRDPTILELDHTPAQRRADALVEMAVRSRTMPAGGRRPEPLFTVLVGWETLSGRVCELANGTVVTPGTLVPWLDSAWLERVMFDSPSRVIDVGHRRRLFTGATRRAVQVRDRECFHRTCEATVDECQVDHVVPWAADGPTIAANGRLACGVHNRQRHDRAPP